MTTALLIAAVVILMCLALSRATHKLGIPALMVFILLGMLFGQDGVFRIAFDDYAFAEQVCTVSLRLREHALSDMLFCQELPPIPAVTVC